MNHGSMADPFSVLPNDIIFNILIRLPLKTISACKWVSKSLYDSILNPRFAELHFSKYKDDFPCAIFLSWFKTSYFIDPVSLSNFETSATAYDLNLKEFKKNFTNCKGWINFEVGGTMNGLVCFSLESDHNDPTPYCVVNPMTRDYTLIPKSPKISVADVGSGFGFDSVKNEYKVVRILPNPSEDRRRGHNYGTEDGNELEYGNKIEIYTLGSGVWRESQLTTDVPSLTILSMRGSNVFVDGHLHWSPLVKIESNYGGIIISFGMASEEFNRIQMPSLLEKRGMLFDLVVLNDCLCIMDGCFQGRKDVWMMKKYGVHNSWAKVYTIEPEFFPLLWGGFHEVIELKNKELLLVDRSHNLIYYDCKKKSSMQIVLHDLKGNRVQVKPTFPVYLKGSLLSPKAIDSICEGN